ncbi:assembly of actin patch protein [Malassezia cuniculi]|uniref:Assembly of actin patch protein n=1 Tax=Malassezia cuniculi TaxID=948313 RepID=A0AAF0EX50_9BASI|nr:assembly of actin patch protein [Malassezia cuniculi]
MAVNKHSCSHEHDLELNVGDDVRVIDYAPDKDSSWLVGETADGRQGIFPESAIQRKDAPAAAVPAQVGAAEEHSPVDKEVSGAPSVATQVPDEAAKAEEEAVSQDAVGATAVPLAGDAAGTPTDTAPSVPTDAPADPAATPTATPAQDTDTASSTAEQAQNIPDAQPDKAEEAPAESNAAETGTNETATPEAPRESNTEAAQPEAAAKPKGISMAAMAVPDVSTKATDPSRMSLRDRIAAFNNPAKNTAPPPIPRGKPLVWKRPQPTAEKPPLPVQSSAPKPGVIRRIDVPVRGEPVLASTQSSLNADDARSSIKVSLKERMAALQKNDAAQKAPPPAPPKKLRAEQVQAAQAPLSEDPEDDPEHRQAIARRMAALGGRCVAPIIPVNDPATPQKQAETPDEPVEVPETSQEPTVAPETPTEAPKEPESADAPEQQVLSVPRRAAAPRTRRAPKVQTPETAVQTPASNDTAAQHVPEPSVTDANRAETEENPKELLTESTETLNEPTRVATEADTKERESDTIPEASREISTSHETPEETSNEVVADAPPVPGALPVESATEEAGSVDLPAEDRDEPVKPSEGPISVSDVLPQVRSAPEETAPEIASAKPESTAEPHIAQEISPAIREAPREDATSALSSVEPAEDLAEHVPTAISATTADAPAPADDAPAPADDAPALAAPEPSTLVAPEPSVPAVTETDARASPEPSAPVTETGARAPPEPSAFASDAPADAEPAAPASPAPVVSATGAPTPAPAVPSRAAPTLDAPAVPVARTVPSAPAPAAPQEAPILAATPAAPSAPAPPAKDAHSAPVSLDAPLPPVPTSAASVHADPQIIPVDQAPAMQETPLPKGPAREPPKAPSASQVQPETQSAAPVVPAALLAQLDGSNEVSASISESQQAPELSSPVDGSTPVSPVAQSHVSHLPPPSRPPPSRTAPRVPQTLPSVSSRPVLPPIHTAPYMPSSSESSYDTPRIDDENALLAQLSQGAPSAESAGASDEVDYSDQCRQLEELLGDETIPEPPVPSPSVSRVTRLPSDRRPKISTRPPPSPVPSAPSSLDSPTLMPPAYSQVTSTVIDGTEPAAESLDSDAQRSVAQSLPAQEKQEQTPADTPAKTEMELEQERREAIMRRIQRIGGQRISGLPIPVRASTGDAPGRASPARQSSVHPIDGYADTSDSIISPSSACSEGAPSLRSPPVRSPPTRPPPLHGPQSPSASVPPTPALQSVAGSGVTSPMTPIVSDQPMPNPMSLPGASLARRPTRTIRKVQLKAIELDNHAIMRLDKRKNTSQDTPAPLPMDEDDLGDVGDDVPEDLGEDLGDPDLSETKMPENVGEPFQEQADTASASSVDPNVAALLEQSRKEIMSISQ